MTDIIVIDEIDWNLDNEPRDPPKDQTILDTTISHFTHTYANGETPQAPSIEFDLFKAIVTREGPKYASRLTTATPNKEETTGSMTLADLPHNPPPPQLCHPFLDPEGTTVIYGKGGAGKGLLAIWMTMQMVRNGKRVLIIDYEKHPGEWGRRAHALGMTKDEMDRVHYRAPFSEEWTTTKGPLISVAEALWADCQNFNIDIIIVDSYTTATSTGDSLGGADAAQEFFNAVTRIGLPCLVLAHVAGGKGRFPDRPFGTVFVHNLARETWAVEQTTDDEQDIPWDPTTSMYQPTVLNLELRNMKKSTSNESRPQFVTFEFNALGELTGTLKDTASNARLIEKIGALLERAKRALTLTDMARLLNSEGTSTTSETLRKTIERDRGRTIKTNDTAPMTFETKKNE
jgi:hypothetical protein